MHSFVLFGWEEGEGRVGIEERERGGGIEGEGRRGEGRGKREHQKCIKYKEAEVPGENTPLHHTQILADMCSNFF